VDETKEILTQYVEQALERLEPLDLPEQVKQDAAYSMAGIAIGMYLQWDHPDVPEDHIEWMEVYEEDGGGVYIAVKNNLAEIIVQVSG